MNKPVLENREEISDSIETTSLYEKQSKNVRQDMPLDDSKIIPEHSSKDLDRKPILHRENSDLKQTYIGIGILAMAVIMLVLIIYLCLRKNRHQIFSKNLSKFSISLFLFNCSYIFFSFKKSPHKHSK